MINKRALIAIILLLVAIAIVYRTTITYNCGPGCTTNPEKIAAGCRACPTQAPAVEIVELEAPATEECDTCDQKTEDFFHDSIYTPATQDI